MCGLKRIALFNRWPVVSLTLVLALYLIVSGAFSLFVAFRWKHLFFREFQPELHMSRVQLFLCGGWYLATGIAFSWGAILLIKNRMEEGRIVLALGTFSSWIITMKTFSAWWQLHRTFDLIELVFVFPAIAVLVIWIIKMKPDEPSKTV